MELTTIIGYLAAIGTTSSFIPQAYRTIKTHHTKDLSLTMYVLFVIGVTFWLIYGILLKEPPIIIANTVTLSLASTILVMKLKYG